MQLPLTFCGLAFGFWLTEMFKFTTKLNSQKLTLRCCYTLKLFTNEI